MAARRPSRRTIALQVIAMAAAMVMGLFILVRTPALDEGDALAAPPTPKASASANAPAPPATPAPPAALALPAAAADAAATAAPAADAAAGDAAGEDPIDRAIAPDGGVPFHPSGTTYRSPFAKPDAGAPVRVRVGMLLNSVDDYDVKTGRYAADFFLSLTSDAPMPNVRLAFPNGSSRTRRSSPTSRRSSCSGSSATSSRRPTSEVPVRFAGAPDLRRGRTSAGIDQVRFLRRQGTHADRARFRIPRLAGRPTSRRAP